MSKCKIVIVGAGPYGLSLAAYLRAKGMQDFTILGSPMDSWRRHMPKGMRLRSEPFASNLWDPDRSLTLEAYCRSHELQYRPVSLPLPLETFLDYAQWFCRKAVPEIQDVTLEHLAVRNGGFDLALANGGQISARQVVLATGIVGHHHIPTELRPLPRDLVLHSRDVRETTCFAGKSVVLVGAGQSALETAALLHEEGAHVSILVRQRGVIWNAPSRASVTVWQRLLRPEAGIGIGWRAWVLSELPQIVRHVPGWERALDGNRWGPRGAAWLCDRLANVSILMSHRIVRAEERQGRAWLSVASAEGMRELVADHVIAATGYRFDVERLPFLHPTLRAAIKTNGSAPELNSQFESTVPGLHFIGAAATASFGPAMRFMYGAKHCAARLVSSMRPEASRPRAVRIASARGTMSTGSKQIPAEGDPSR